MRRIPALLALLLAVGLVAAPASATPARTGEALNLVVPCLTGGDIGPQAADDDFHVAHGFAQLDPIEDAPLGAWRFDLWVDGKKQSSHLDLQLGDEGVSRTFVSNFRGGLSADDHEFRAVWSGPDGVLIDCTRNIEFTA